MPGEAEPVGQVRSWDTNTMPWEIRHIDELDGDLAAKQLIQDPDTGMSVMKMKYFAGFTNEWHTHNCAHGIYVLDGILQTPQPLYNLQGTRTATGVSRLAVTTNNRGNSVVPSRPVGALLGVLRRGQAPRATGQDPWRPG
jgi:hypothetical protein